MTYESGYIKIKQQMRIGNQKTKKECIYFIDNVQEKN